VSAVGERGQLYRVRIENLRGEEPVRWLGPSRLPWSYVDDPAGAGAWGWDEAARIAAEYRRGQAWRGRYADTEPVDQAAAT
jgi:hypothetical protein